LNLKFKKVFKTYKSRAVAWEPSVVENCGRYRNLQRQIHLTRFPVTLM